MKDVTRAAQAISDETRLRILNLIMEQECCVCEVMQALDISQTRASRNLKVLYEAGFLNLRNDGLFTLYSIKNSKNGFFSNFIEGVRTALTSNKTAKNDLERLREARRIGPGCVKEESPCPTC